MHAEEGLIDVDRDPFRFLTLRLLDGTGCFIGVYLDYMRAVLEGLVENNCSMYRAEFVRAGLISEQN